MIWGHQRIDGRVTGSYYLCAPDHAILHWHWLEIVCKAASTTHQTLSEAEPHPLPFPSLSSGASMELLRFVQGSSLHRSLYAKGSSRARILKRMSKSNIPCTSGLQQLAQ